MMSYYVYILRSKVDKKQIYIGYTTNIDKRIERNSKPDASAYTR